MLPALCVIAQCQDSLCRRHASKHTVYKFYVDGNGAPLRLHMHGNDIFSGAHFDICECLAACSWHA